LIVVVVVVVVFVVVVVVHVTFVVSGLKFDNFNVPLKFEPQ